MSKRDFPRNYMMPPPPGNPRNTEAWALTQAANRLKAGRDSADREAMLAAARLNWRLWTIIQSELLDPMSTVPLEVRVNVLSLCRYVDTTTVDFLANPQATKLDSLTAINRKLASGLYSSAGVNQPPGTENAVADQDWAGIDASQDARAPSAESGSLRLTI